MNNVNTGYLAGKQVLAQLRDMQSQAKVLNDQAAGKETRNGPSFTDHLKENLSEVNEMQRIADKMSTDIATGKSQNIHETMLAVTKAELTFNLMVQVRNKVLEAYQEVMRMQV